MSHIRAIYRIPQINAEIFIVDDKKQAVPGGTSMLVNEFLSILRQHNKDFGISISNLQSLELLTIRPLPGGLCTPKVLDQIPAEDVIEVFI